MDAGLRMLRGTADRTGRVYRPCAALGPRQAHDPAGLLTGSVPKVSGAQERTVPFRPKRHDSQGLTVYPVDRCVPPSCHTVEPPSGPNRGCASPGSRSGPAQARFAPGPSMIDAEILLKSLAVKPRASEPRHGWGEMSSSMFDHRACDRQMKSGRAGHVHGPRRR